MNAFDKSYFINNRSKLSNALPNFLIIIAANSALQYSADEAYPFRQDSSFWYFSGFDEPDALLVIDTSKGETTLLLPKLNEYQNLWDGSYDKPEISKTSGINSFGSIEELAIMLKKAVKDNISVGYLKPAEIIVEPYGFYSNPARRNLELKIQNHGLSPVDIRVQIARIRQQKQPIEIKLIQETIDITNKSLANLKKLLPKLKTEQEVLKNLTIEFLKNGAEEHGFPPVIASGSNAATIHYRKSASTLQDNSLLLLDVGVKKNKFVSDISRTWSVGKISDRQKNIYNAVLEIQNQAFSMLKPGVLLRDYQEKVEDLIKKHMKELKIPNAEDKFPHGISHFLGLDVHDSGDYGEPLTENSVLTVEPGIYIPEEGVGVRIEDIVLITKNGIEILSKDIPRSL